MDLRIRPNHSQLGSGGSFLPKNAIILAAGFGSRIQQNNRVPLSKPLIELGGLYLIERAVLNLHAAGIRKIRVVVGAYKEKIILTLQNLKSLQNINIEFVECADFEKGNGASLHAGACGIEESFLVVMSDHVMSPNLIPHFVKNVVATDPSKIYLATDPNVQNVFDLEDATKIQVKEGRILEIGKNLKDFNQIDTGLFYFPQGASKGVQEAYAAGRYTVSEIVNELKVSFGFMAQTIHPKSFWQDVDTPEMAREAEKRLLASLVSEEDGWISHYLNRPISLKLSLILSRLRCHPNLITSFVLALSLVASYLASRAEAISVAFAGILFQVASILDGCDGEVARLTFKQSRVGAGYEALASHLRYGTFFFALGWGLWTRGGPSLYLLGAFLFVLFLIHLVIRMLRYELKIAPEINHRVVSREVLKWGTQTQSTWASWIIQLRNLAKQDFIAFLAMIFCLLGGAGIFFWMTCVGLVLVTLIVDHVLAKKDKIWVRGAVHSLLGSELSFVFFAGGAALMIWIYGTFPMAGAFEKNLAHPGLLWLLFVIPLGWFGLNSVAISVLVNKAVSFSNILKSQIAGEALNALVPVSGMMVEPVKAKYLSQWLPPDQADRSVFKDRILHVTAGLSFASLLGLFLALSPQMPVLAKVSLFFISCILGGCALYFLRVLFDPDTSGRVMSLLIHLGILNEKKNFKSFTKREIFKAWVAKVLGRSLNLIEIACLFFIVGQEPDVFPVTLVMIGISLTSIVGFWIPQGLGLHELAVILVFKFLNLPLDAAVVLCALRRLRMLGFSFVGVTFLVKQISFKKVKNSVENFS